MSDDDDLLFSDPEAAKYLNVSTRTFQRMREEGQVRYMRIGARCVRTEKRELDAYKAARTFRSRAAELAQQAA